eukprot:1142327-Pelagomonas_calceolata.AAC.3
MPALVAPLASACRTASDHNHSFHRSDGCSSLVRRQGRHSSSSGGTGQRVQDSKAGTPALVAPLASACRTASDHNHSFHRSDGCPRTVRAGQRVITTMVLIGQMGVPLW